MSPLPGIQHLARIEGLHPSATENSPRPKYPTTYTFPLETSARLTAPARRARRSSPTPAPLQPPPAPPPPPSPPPPRSKPPSQSQRKPLQRQMDAHPISLGYQQPTPSRAPIMCPFPGCGRILCRRAYLAAHLSVHSGEKAHPCVACPMVFRFRSNLRR